MMGMNGTRYWPIEKSKKRSRSIVEYFCAECGAAVIDLSVHDEWHKRLDEIALVGGLRRGGTVRSPWQPEG